MFRKLVAAAVVLAAFAFTGQTASAGGSDKRVRATGIVVGAAATATYFSINGWEWKWNSTNPMTAAGAYALTTGGCIAVAPIAATLVVNRPLTMREAHVLAGSCIIPIVGGMVVDAIWNANPQWEAGAKPAAKRVAKKK